MRRIIAMLAGAALAFGLLGAAPASAGVERYQFTDVVIDMTSVNGTTNYWHDYTLHHNPCTDTWTVSEATGSQGPETLSHISLNGSQLTYTSDYDNTTYVYTATIEADGALSLVSSASNVTSVGGTGSITQTSYNHGEYVAESIDDYGPDAHSCIGKPVVSKS